MLESQKILLKLLKEIDEICKKHDITYYLVGGSALGAVRHHGFLPWDDDADIVMDHENYMKFVEVMSDPANIPKDRAYEDPFIAPYTQINVFGRYSAVDTTCIFDVLCLCDSVHGIKVDVFHLISCPDEGPEREAFLRKFRTWAELCHPYARNKELVSEDYRRSREEMRKKGVDKYRKQLFDDLHIENYSDSSQYLYCYEKLLFFYDKDIFGKPVYFPFEDTTLPVPTKYSKHFRILFGDDWFCIPDTSEQIQHKIAQDEHRSYIEYTSDYTSFTSADTDKMFEDYKLNVVRGWEKQRELEKYKIRMRTKIVEKKIDIFWKENADTIKRLFKKGEYRDVVELSKPYLDEQVNDFSITKNVFFEADKELFKCAALSCMYISDNKKARRLLNLASNRYKGEDIDAIYRYLEEKDMIVEMEENDEDISTVFELNERLLESSKDDRDLQLRKARILLRKDPIGNREEIEKICIKHKKDGDFIILLAKLAEDQGQVKLAAELYKDAQENTKNGLVILESNTSLKRLM